MSVPLRIRPAARAVVMDPDRRVLLVHFEFGAEDLPHGLWACPGGGIDPGESTAEGLVRELAEEIGLFVEDPGPPIWWKEHVFPMRRWDGQRDVFHLVEVDAFEPAPQFTEAELRAEYLDDMRWWEYSELQAAQALYDAGQVTAPGYTVFSPRRLGHLVKDLVAHGRPDVPLQLDPR